MSLQNFRVYVLFIAQIAVALKSVMVKSLRCAAEFMMPGSQCRAVREGSDAPTPPVGTKTVLELEAGVGCAIAAQGRGSDDEQRR